jgi:hypothetical protein
MYAALTSSPSMDRSSFTQNVRKKTLAKASGHDPTRRERPRPPPTTLNWLKQ